MSHSGLVVRLQQRPASAAGIPATTCFSVSEEPVAAARPGEVVVRNLLFSVDPYMRARMNAAKSYAPPYDIGGVLDGAAVGTVVESRADGLREGTVVTHNFGWREWAVADASCFEPVDTTIAPASAYLGPLGMTGFTAYVGLIDIANLRESEAVFISGAAGAVGSIAGQVARLRGASRVIGSTSGKRKCAHVLDTLGFDAAIDYRQGHLVEQLRAAAPDRFDVYFDNVGGDHLEAALSVIRPFGRIVLCGSMSSQASAEPSHCPRNLPIAIGKRLTLRGFLVGDHKASREAFLRDMGGWLADGAIHAAETVVHGVEHAPDALIGLMRGDNIGKMLVSVTSR